MVVGAYRVSLLSDMYQEFDVVSFDVGISPNGDSQELHSYVGVLGDDGTFQYLTNQEVIVVSSDTDVYAYPRSQVEHSYINGRKTTVPTPEEAGLVHGNRYPVLHISAPIRNHQPVDAYITVVNDKGEIWSVSSHNLTIEVDRSNNPYA